MTDLAVSPAPAVTLTATSTLTTPTRTTPTAPPGTDRDGTAATTTDIDPRVEQMSDVIMKKCLWQFHSRAWDRLRQNEKILGMLADLLCGTEIDLSDPLERCYWVDARYLADAYRERFAWLADLDETATRDLVAQLRARIDYLTVTGSRNEELTDQHY